MNRHVRTQVEFRMREERAGEGSSGRKRKGYEGQKRSRTQRGEAGGEVTKKKMVRTKTAKARGMAIAGSVRLLSESIREEVCTTERMLRINSGWRDEREPESREDSCSDRQLE